jgi:hypothetical protein
MQNIRLNHREWPCMTLVWGFGGPLVVYYIYNLNTTASIYMYKMMIDYYNELSKECSIIFV